jgi:tRNA(Ile)-lysidine synthase
VLSVVLRTLREHGLVAVGDRVLVGISGGPDSTALLHALVTLAPRLRIFVQAACVDHRLRPESAEEALAVVRRCRALGVDCEVLSVDVAAAKKAHVSLQAAARDARLAALDAAAERAGCTRIALGHTVDDQAETVLFRIVRGTGLAGLAGIPYVRGRFIRPLLDIRRAQILAYLHKRKLDYVSDPSNANRRFARSRIRHDILPLLARENPRVVEALLGLAREVQAGPGRAWRSALPPDLYLPGQTVRVIERLVREAGGTRTVSVPDGEIVVTYGQVAFVPQAPIANPATAAETIIEQLGTYRVLPPPAPSIRLTATSGFAGPSPGPLPQAGHEIAAFDRGKLGWPLRLRPIRPGDRMAPRGGRGSRKLSDLLIDAKIPRRERAVLPVLCDALGTVLFVPGLRPAECGRPTDKTRDLLQVHVLR